MNEVKMKKHLNTSSNRLLRLNAILFPNGPIPVSKSTWWAGVKDGRFPKPIKLSPRVTVWRETEVLALLDREGE